MTGDYATFTCWPEVVEVLEEVLQLKRISLDQGAVLRVQTKEHDEDGGYIQYTLPMASSATASSGYGGGNEKQPVVNKGDGKGSKANRGAAALSSPTASSMWARDGNSE